MSDHHVIASEGKYRVVAKQDEFADKPEHMGWPEAILSWDRFGATMETSWDGVVDEDAILNAFSEFNDSDTFTRWLRIFAEDLVDLSKLYFTDDELADDVIVQVGRAHGYSQGDVWIVLQWRPKESEVWDEIGFDPERSGLANWARGDVYYLELQEQVTWSADDERFEDHTEWEYVDASHDFFTSDPDNTEWLLDEAQGMIPSN